MADLGIWTSNAQIAVRAGANVNATAITIAETDKYVLDVEAYINNITRVNWSDLVTAGLNVDVEGLLREASACICAMYAINYDLSSFTDLAHAQTMLNVLYDRSQKAIALLKDKKREDFVKDA